MFTSRRLQYNTARQGNPYRERGNVLMFNAGAPLLENSNAF
jgi:hypothetical protein